MKSFSAYYTPALGAAIDAASAEPYPMEFHRGEELNAICAAINQGIDSHLEAIMFSQDTGECGRTRIVLRPNSVRVLVRRLMESESEAAQSLASSICETLDIELI